MKFDEQSGPSLPSASFKYSLPETFLHSNSVLCPVFLVKLGMLENIGNYDTAMADSVNYANGQGIFG